LWDILGALIMLTPIKLFSSDDIDKLNEDLWRTIYQKGNPLKFGSIEESKDAREIFSVVQLYGRALDRLYRGELPKGWMFGKEANKVYIEMLKDPDRGEQPYTYGERLHNYRVWSEISEWVSYIDQMDECKIELEEAIKSGIQNNRICGVIWNPLDIFLKNPPCYNWFQLRTSEGNKVSLRVLFRSHDYGNANFANFGAIIRAFQDEVIRPAGGILEELICVSTSAHLYNNDLDMVENLVGKVPESMRRLLK